MTLKPDEGPGLCRNPHLFLVVQGHAPLAPPLRLFLGDLDEIQIGRGKQRKLSQIRPRHLDVRLEDPWSSTNHARVSRLSGRWVFQDGGSKNGSFVNGVKQAHVKLEDGDILEVGRTFFVYRDNVETHASDPAVLDAGETKPPVSSLATMWPELARVFARLAMVSRSNIEVLIGGETGTGKEVMARAVHELSGRKGDFVAVNCGALPRDLVEAELFGARKGAFSGALQDRLGLVQAAHQGTLFLDEIGDLPLPAQAALLRVLQEREVRPIGSTRPVDVDLRVVAATHRPLDQMVQAGNFRADLVERLAGHRVTLPPLRERREDLGLLIAAIVRQVAPERASRIQLHPNAVNALLRHGWKGNVRELHKAIGTALVLAGQTAGESLILELEHLPEAIQHKADEKEPKPHDEPNRRDELEALLREHKGNISAMARALGEHRFQVQRWLKRYGLDPETFRP